jgi:hypothetical protein
VNEEARDLIARFMAELSKATGDGQVKRRLGKPPWYADDAHEAAIFSHLTKWKRGEKADRDSGAHPLVHAAWRCLAIACRESGNVPAVANQEGTNGDSRGVGAGDQAEAPRM